MAAGYGNALKVRDQLVQHVAAIRRIGHNAIAAAVVIEFKRIPTGTDIALVGAAQAEPLTRSPSPQHGSTEVNSASAAGLR